MANTWAMVEKKPNITPCWAVCWHFIPVANLWKPYEVMSEIWRGVFDDSKSRALLLLWWLLWIVANIFDFMRQGVSLIPNGLSTVAIIAVVSNSLAAVLLIRIISVISKGQKGLSS